MKAWIFHKSNGIQSALNQTVKKKSPPDFNVEMWGVARNGPYIRYNYNFVSNWAVYSERQRVQFISIELIFIYTSIDGSRLTEYFWPPRAFLQPIPDHYILFNSIANWKLNKTFVRWKCVWLETETLSWRLIEKFNHQIATKKSPA